MKKITRRLRWSVIHLSLLLGFLLSAGTAQAQGRSWQVTLDNTTNGLYLSSVAANSPNDVWMIAENKPQLLHWNGTGVEYIPEPPTSGTGYGYAFEHVATGMSNDVFVSGTLQNSANASLRMLAHWDGTNWSVVSGQNPIGTIQSVSFAPGTHNAWGIQPYRNRSNASASQPQIQQWNGRAWRSAGITAPCSCVYGYNSVDAQSPKNVWVTGSYTQNSTQVAFIEHWDGTKWQLQTAPVGTTSFSHFFYSHGHFWADGVQNGNSFLAYWNGSSWQRIPYPQPANGMNWSAFLLTANNDIWAVGSVVNQQTQRNNPAAVHWNGQTWSTNQAAPSNFVTRGATLLAITDIPGSGDFWAVGIDSNGFLAEAYR